jgi:hypothetical protein
MDSVAIRRYRLSGIIVGVVVLSAVLWGSTGVRDPSYQGKPLGFWLRALDGQGDRDAALHAIDAIGAASIPSLLHRLEATDSSIKLKVLNLGVRLGAIDLSRAVALSASTRRSEAVAAFTRLGTQAKAAIPELLKLTQNPDSNIRTSAWQALAQVAGDDFNRYLTTKPVPLQSEEERVESLPATN